MERRHEDEVCGSGEVGGSKPDERVRGDVNIIEGGEV